MSFNILNFQVISEKYRSQVGAMAHGKIDADYVDDFISGRWFKI